MSTHKRILLDCGFYYGAATRNLLRQGVIDKKWLIHAFEPNPEIDIKKVAEEFPLKIETHQEAVWIKNGKVSFTISIRDNASHIKGTCGHCPKKTVKVTSIDFSSFVAKLPKAFIYCSMDIEGAEYKVLKKMIKDKTIDRINVLETEYHDRFMDKYPIEDWNKLKNDIRKRGIKVISEE